MAVATALDEAAALLTWLQANDAICYIDEGGFLNPVAAIQGMDIADRLAREVLRLREELKTINRSSVTVH